MYGLASRVSWLVLFLVLCSSLSSWASGEARDSQISSTESGLPQLLTTPTDASLLSALLPSLLEVKQKSHDLSESLLDFNEQVLQLKKQRLLDNAQRTLELSEWGKTSSLLYARVWTLNNYWTELSSLLGNFSGTEAEKEAAALKALDNLKSEAQKHDAEIVLLRIGVVTLAVTTLGLGIATLGYALSWW